MLKSLIKPCRTIVERTVNRSLVPKLRTPSPLPADKVLLGELNILAGLDEAVARLGAACRDLGLQCVRIPIVTPQIYTPQCVNINPT